MPGPTTLTELMHFPNIAHSKKRSVKFFLCDNGHVEEWAGEEPITGDKPRRLCNECRAIMALVSRRVDKAGNLVPFVRTKKAKTVPVKPKRPPTPARLLDRLIRAVKHPYIEYKADRISPTEARLTRKGERPRQVGMTLYYRYIKLTALADKVEARLYGVAGWFEELRIASRQTKVPIATQLLSEDARVIVVKKADKKKGKAVKNVLSKKKPVSKRVAR